MEHELVLTTLLWNMSYSLQFSMEHELLLAIFYGTGVTPCNFILNMS
jgi:hypothetical protein